MDKIPIECLKDCKTLYGYLVFDTSCGTWHLKLEDGTHILGRFLETTIKQSTENNILNIRGLKGTRLELRHKNNKYIVDLFINNKKSETQRHFNTREEAEGEIERISKGLMLPSKFIDHKIIEEE